MTDLWTPNWNFTGNRPQCSNASYGTTSVCTQCGPNGYGNYSMLNCLTGPYGPTTRIKGPQGELAFQCDYRERASRNRYDYDSGSVCRQAARQQDYSYDDMAEPDPPKTAAQVFPTYGGRYWGDLDPTRARPYNTHGSLEVTGYNTDQLRYGPVANHPDGPFEANGHYATGPSGCHPQEYGNGDYQADKGLRDTLGAATLVGKNLEGHRWPQPGETSYCSL